MFPFSHSRGGGAAQSALKFTSAGGAWSISGDGLTATRDSSSGASGATTSIARSTGPAAVLFKPLTGTVANIPSLVVALYPPGTAVNSPPTTNRVGWRGDGSININGTDAFSAGAARQWGPGDQLKIRIDAAGTTAFFIRNGTQVASTAITAISRVPFVNSAGGSVFIVSIDGAPVGETAWG